MQNCIANVSEGCGIFLMRQPQYGLRLSRTSIILRNAQLQSFLRRTASCNTCRLVFDPMAVYADNYLARLLAASGPRKVCPERQAPSASYTAVRTDPSTHQLDMANLFVHRRAAVACWV